MGISASQERYVNFYTDFAFKKLFGTEVNKELLISFLNSLFDGREVIKDLKYLNGEHLGHVASERKAVFDVYCENEQAEIAAFNKEELHDYRESQKDFWDLNSVLETAERKGDRKRQISTAKSLKAMGVLTDSQIAEATGLSEDEVRGIGG